MKRRRKVRTTTDSGLGTQDSAISSPTLALVSVKHDQRYPDREGKTWIVTTADVGRITQFGVGPRAGEALVQLNRADLQVWIPVENLEIVNHVPEHSSE